jgi:hypothetical protein
MPLVILGIVWLFLPSIKYKNRHALSQQAYEPADQSDRRQQMNRHQFLTSDKKNKELNAHAIEDECKIGGYESNDDGALSDARIALIELLLSSNKVLQAQVHT